MVRVYIIGVTPLLVQSIDYPTSALVRGVTGPNGYATLAHLSVGGSSSTLSPESHLVFTKVL